MNKKLIPLILAGTTMLTACNQEQAVDSANNSSASPATIITKDDAIAVVNGTFISKKALADLEKEVSQRSRGQNFPKEKLIEELVQRELLLQEATNKQLDKTTEFTDRLATIKDSLLSQSAIQNHMKSNPVTDEELKVEYDEKMAKTGIEYKARHILVKTEEESKKIIAELDKGADFAELAKKKSTGPSGPKGGDLGWFTADRMVPPFSEAVIALEKNKYTPEAVKTQFGWHVIKREDSRAQTPPPFESVKEQFRSTLQRNKMQDYMENLRKQAKVEIFEPEVVVPAIDDVSKLSETAKSASKESGNAVVEAAGNAKQAATEAAEKLSETAGSAKQAVTEGVAKASNKLSDTAQAASEKAKAAFTEAAEKAKAAAAEKAAQTVDKISETIKTP